MKAGPAGEESSFRRGNPGLPRWVDAVAAAIGMVLASPFFLLLAVAVRFSSPGPVLFRQARVGRGGRTFTMLKFRTMRPREGGTRVTASGDPRITAVGRLLRALKLDELPELWNVLRGEMALVGPRPEVPEMVDLADPLWREVLAARPGVTDPVTLRLRNEEELLAAAGGDPERFYRERLRPWKLRGYTEYLRNRSAWSDLEVLFATLAAVVRPVSARPPSLTEIDAASGTDQEASE